MKSGLVKTVIIVQKNNIVEGTLYILGIKMAE